MPLAPGTRLGAYEIVEPLGAGGMGEVFKARDTKLGRDVALKLLSEAFGADPDRLARFRREAQLLAALNHPNVASIYGLEEADGKVALVLELVPGQGLDDRLRAGAIPVDEALRIARQIALGLEAAHEKGIIHRDLKPANIRLTLDGDVKLLDFGLAKAWEGDEASGDVSQSPTLSRHMTEAGLILGTAAYMSPEQARGKRVDKRADVWAFGVVLFEMLTGRKLFGGETVSDTLAAVLRQDVEWQRLPVETPVPVRRLLRRCLERDPKQRLHDIGDARLELEEKVEPAPAPAPSAPPRASHGPWYVAAGLAVALAIALLRHPSPTATPAPATRLTVELTTDQPLSSLWGPNVVLSPDGRTLAWVVTDDATGRRWLRLRRLDSAEVTNPSGTDGLRSPFFSPDGRFVAFCSQGSLLRLSVDGGPVTRISGGLLAEGRGATWTDGGEIVFTGAFDRGLSRVAASGGEPKPLTVPDLAAEERSHRWPWALPGGKAVLFMTQHVGQDYDNADIEAVSLETGKRSVLVHGGSFPRYAAGHLLYVREGALLAAPFDPATLSVGAPGRRVLEGLLAWTGDQEGGDGSAEYSVSDEGTLLYRSAPIRAASQGSKFLWVDRDGRQEDAFEESVRVLTFRLSPDGTRVAFTANGPRGIGIYVRDLARGGTAPLTSEGTGDRDAVWSPDGRQIVYSARTGGGRRLLRIHTMDGSAPDRDLPATEGSWGPTSWSPDGRTLIVDNATPEGQLDLFAVPLDDPAKIRTILKSPAPETGGRISPNGRWLAYASAESGRIQVYATPLAGGPRWPVSTDIGSQPVWSPDGRTLFFRTESRMYAASVEERGDGLVFGAPRLMSNLRASGPFGRPSFDLRADGRMLIELFDSVDEGARESHHAMVVFNWPQELKRRLLEAAP